MIKKDKKNLQAEMGAQALVDFMRSLYPISQELQDYLRENAHFLKVKKNKIILKTGEICSNYYFLLKGIMRAYIVYDGKEVTIWINPENEIITSVKSMKSQVPVVESIQALEDCEVMVMTYDTVRYMYENFMEMNIIGRIILEDYYSDSEERSIISRIPSAEKKYEHFLNTRPELLNRLPLKYVASYLGITEETLSRLRRKKLKGEG
jgi:CRP-like cAMP-binding protein